MLSDRIASLLGSIQRQPCLTPSMTDPTPLRMLFPLRLHPLTADWPCQAGTTHVDPRECRLLFLLCVITFTVLDPTT